MFQTQVFPYAAGNDWQLLSLPFARSDLEMLVLLPQSHAVLAKVESGITLDWWKASASALANDKFIHVMLPRFKFSTLFDCSGLWQAHGVKSLFSINADLSGLTTEPVALRQILHQTTIEVNESGADAQAETFAEIEPFAGDSDPTPNIKVRAISFQANRPFVWIIRHAPTGLILFLGRFAGEA